MKKIKIFGIESVRGWYFSDTLFEIVFE